jgi:PKD repeat protein
MQTKIFGMKKLFKYIGVLLFCCLSVMAVQSQNCKQVDIVFQSLDCFKPKGDVNGTSPVGNDRRGCREVSACKNQPMNYSASGTGWVTYNWVTTGPAIPIITPATNVQNITVTWPVVGTYILTLTVTDINGDTLTNCIKVTVKDKPVANFSFAPTNPCAGSTVNFTNSTTSSGPVAYSWDFGDPASGINNTSTQTNPSHIYNANGVYTITLIAYSFEPGDSTLKACCSDTIKKTITVGPTLVNIDCISTVCHGDTAYYTVTGCGATPSVTIGGGTLWQQTGNKIAVIWGNGAVQGSINVNCGGCIASATVPIIPANPVIVGNTTPCFGALQSYSVPYLPGSFYTWQLLNTSTGNYYNQLINTFPDNNQAWINWTDTLAAGSYQLTVTINNKHLCCNGTGSLLITPKPKFTINAFPSPACVNSPVFFYSQINPNIGTVAANWTANPSLGVSFATPTGSSSTNGFFTIGGNYIVTATDNSGNFCNNTATTSVTIVGVPTPGAIFGPATVCPGSGYTYTMSTPAPPGFVYNWTITGGVGNFLPSPTATTATGDTVSIQWTTVPGTISVTLVGTAAPFCSSAAVTMNVAQGTMGTISGAVNVCADGTALYSIVGGTLPPGQAVTWSIIPPNLGTITPVPGNPLAVNVLWHGNGSSAVLQASSGCGTAPITVNISIPPPGTLTQSGTNFCTGITLTAGAGSGYIWSGPGAPLTGNPVTIIQGGTYSVSYIISGGCRVTASITIPPANPCGLNITTPGPTLIDTCQGPVSINTILQSSIGPGCTGYSYQWFRNGSPVTGSSPGNTIYTATSVGTYYVVATNGFCVLTSNNIVISYLLCSSCVCPSPPTGNLLISNINCNTYQFTSTYPGTASWQFGDGSSASGNIVTHTFTGITGYIPMVLHVPCPPNCTIRRDTIVFVPLAPDFNFSVNCKTACFTDLTQVYAGSGGSISSWAWNFGDPASGAGNSATGANPCHVFTGPGTYTVSMTATYSHTSPTPFTCTTTFTKNVIITAPNAPPIVINPNPLCSGQASAFSTPMNNMLSYYWNFGDNAFSYTQNTTHAYTIPNTYTVSLVVTDTLGCKDSNSQVVTVNPGISNCAVDSVFICPTGSATLTAPAGAYTYLWMPGGGTGNTFTVNTPGTYQLTVTNGFGCSCTSTVNVKPAPKVKVNITVAPSTKLCGPQMIAMSTLNVPGYIYQWSVNNVPIPFSNTPTLNQFISVTSTYTVVATDTLYGCSDSCQVTVQVNTPPLPPIITSNPGGTLCAGRPIQLTASPATNILWNTGSTAATITVTTAGLYTVTYTDPVTGCSKSSSIKVNARPPVGLFPHLCDTIGCVCPKPFEIFAPLPLTGAFGNPHFIQWYSGVPPTGTNIGSGPVYSNAPNNIPGGTYYIIATDLNTGCKDTSNTYTVVLKNCDSCACVKDAVWSNLAIDTLPNIQQQGNMPVFCGKRYTVACNKPITISASYPCSADSCKKYTVNVVNSSGVPVYTYTSTSPTLQTGNIVFTTSGTYTATLYGWCGNKICDSCKIYFTVKCDTCACKGWVKQQIEGPGFVKDIVCNSDQVLSIKCKTNYYLNLQYLCTPATNIASFNIYLDNVLQGSYPSPATIPISFLTGGAHTLAMVPYCCGKPCDSCVVKFKVDCPDSCGCKGWVKHYWQQGTGVVIDTVPNGGGNTKAVAIGNVIVPGKPVTIDCKSTQPINVTCNKPYNFVFDYDCSQPNCLPKYVVTATGPAGSWTVYTGTYVQSAFSISNYVFTQSGTYTLNVVAYCNGVPCDSCRIIIKADCKCDCKGWVKQTLEGAGQVQNIECNSNAVVKVKCSTNYFLQLQYACSPASNIATFDVYVNNVLTATNVSSPVNLPVNFNTAGFHNITIIPYCCGKACDTCVIKFYADCPPNCDCGEWKTRYYYEGNGIGIPVDELPKAKVAAANIPVKIPLNCTPNGQTLELKCKKPYNFVFDYDCVGNCLPTYVVTTSGPGGILSAYNGSYTQSAFLMNNVIFSLSGIYTISVKVYCGNKLCAECKIIIKVNCPNECTCKGWGPLQLEGAGVMPTIQCGQTIPVKCKTNYFFSGQYFCNPPSCAAVVNYQLIAPDNSAVSGIYTGSLPMVFTQNGTYTLVLTPTCGGTACGVCRIFFKSEGCEPPPPADCCKEVTINTKVPVANYIGGSTNQVQINNINVSGMIPVKMTATIVSATRTSSLCTNQLPIGPVGVGITMFGSNSTGLSTGSVANAPYGQDILLTGGSWSNGGSLGFSFNVPLQKPCKDAIKICVKLTFYDKDCKVCSKVVCFELVRKWKQ